MGKALVRILRNLKGTVRDPHLYQYSRAGATSHLPQLHRRLLHSGLRSCISIAFSSWRFLRLFVHLEKSQSYSAGAADLRQAWKHHLRGRCGAGCWPYIMDAAPESAEDCMGGLMHLLACSNSQKGCGETVVVLRQLLPLIRI